MCLNEVMQLAYVSADGTSGVGDGGAGRRDVSLVVLTLDGVEPAVGDWVVVTTGLAVERLTGEQARAVRRSRAQMYNDEGTSS
jgi:hydrogenase maturation factor